jgi:hypothetical protein
VTSEFVLQHGMIDAIVPRRELRQALAKLLRLYAPTMAPEVLDGQRNVHAETQLQLTQRTGESDGIRPGL